MFNNISNAAVIIGFTLQIVAPYFTKNVLWRTILEATSVIAWLLAFLFFIIGLFESFNNTKHFLINKGIEARQKNIPSDFVPYEQIWENNYYREGFDKK